MTAGPGADGGGDGMPPSGQPGRAEPPGRSGPPGPRAPRVRPYTLTGGRTHTRSPLEIETLVQTASDADRADQQAEHQVIGHVCHRPISVAEVAARTALPLGVVRVLLDDMARQGTVVLHPPTGERPDRALLERVLNGLQQL